MKRVTVKITAEVHVDISDEDWAKYYADDNHIYFSIEENGCPATGIVGAALDALIEENDATSTCWACACKGQNEILRIEELPNEVDT